MRKFFVLMPPLFAIPHGILRKPSISRFTCVFAILVVSCLCTVRLHAQATASMVGTVHDSAGAVVPGASVTALNPDTGFTRTVVTNSQGFYEITSMPTGPYTLTAVLKGFKQSQVPNIVLQVEQKALVDITLSPGAVTQTVNVTEAPTLIQTESSSLGQVITHQQIVDLPLNGSHVTQLTELTPGAITSNTKGGPGAGSNTGFTTVAVSGGQSEKTEFILDGITDTEQLYNGIQFEPSVDFVQEFKVLSNSFPAEYGRGSAEVLMSTRSGTNQIHGTVFEFLRNNAFDALPYFAAKGTSTAPLHRNQFGAAVGGPILRNRLFYFLNYNGVRLNQPEEKNQIVPSAALRSGNLNGLIGPPAHDPFTLAPFPSNQIPTGELDAAAQYFLNPAIIPLPNQPDGVHFIYGPSATSNTDQGDIRIDYQMSPKDSFFGRFSINDNLAISPGGLPAFGGTTNTINTKNIGVGYTHIFTPNLLNNLRLGYGHLLYENSPQGLGTNYTTQAGILGFDQTSKVFPGYPYLSLGNYASVNGNPYSPLINPTTTWELSDIVSWIKGRHSLSMGVDARRFHLTSTNSAYSRGYFTFSGGFTGNQFADFLTGFPNFGLRDFPRNTFGERDFGIPLFIQDDWKVTSKLTLNLGLRYDLALAPVQDLAQNSYFDITTGKFIVSTYKNGLPNLSTQQVAQTAYDQYSSDIVTPKQAGISNNLQTISKKDFAPRIGFAYRPFDNDTTVIRGAYGVFYTLMPGNPTVSQAIINVPFIEDSSLNAPATPSASSNLENFFNFPFGAGGSVYISAKDLNIRPPYNQEWNLAIQRELVRNLAITVAYAGDKGSRLEKDIPLNEATPTADPSAPLGPRRAWPAFGEGSNFTNIGNSIYNALQITLEKRASSGFTFLSAFTWSKLINDMNLSDQMAVQNPQNLSLDRGLGSQDVKFRSVTSLIYALPFGRGMRFGSNISRPLDLVAGGWRFGAIVQAQSGNPFTPTMEADPANTGYAYDQRPNRNGSGKLSNPTIARWFDYTAFSVPANGTFGTSGRNILRGPGLDDWDISLLKDFHFNQRIYAEFRGEAYNVFNHPQFYNPNTDIQAGPGVSGRITSATGSRQLQVGIKIYF
jgi:hypothetical protein